MSADSTVVEYSLNRDGDKRLSRSFTVAEFRSRCGSDKILIDAGLIELLQQIRDHFGSAVKIVSGYRSPAHNRVIGGAPNSQHMLGKAADIQVKGFPPLEVGQYLKDHNGGLGVYATFTHVDVGRRRRW
jgi:uncharacterized protein YcbK (DUF882 family)